MIFKFPQKKIVLDCFTNRPSVIKLSPISPAIMHTPNWWKVLPNSYRPKNTPFDFDRATMKSCDGMIDYYKESVVIPMWSDLAISIDKNNKKYHWQFSDGISNVGSHAVEQSSGFLSSYFSLKLISPWLFKTKEDIKWVWSHPVYNYEKSNDVVSLPAIVSYRYQTANHIHLFISFEKNQTIIIPHGQPMVFMTPMTDRKVEVVRHLVSDAEYIKIHGNSEKISFKNKYKKIIASAKQFEKCPFKNHMEVNNDY